MVRCILLIIGFFIILKLGTYAQPMLIGVHGGGNYSFMSPSVGDLIFTSSGIDEQDITINRPLSFQNIGFQFGFNIIKPLNDYIALEFSPEQWVSNTFYETTELIQGSTAFEIHREINSKLRYYRFPVHILISRPSPIVSSYISAGVSYGFLRGSNTVVVEGIAAINNDMQRQTSNTETNQVNDAGYVKSRFDVMVSAGLFYDLGWGLLRPSISYNHLLNNLASTHNRFLGAGLGASGKVKYPSIIFDLALFVSLSKNQRKGSAIDCTYVPGGKRRKK